MRTAAHKRDSRGGLALAVCQAYKNLMGSIQSRLRTHLSFIFFHHVHVSGRRGNIGSELWILRDPVESHARVAGGLLIRIKSDLQQRSKNDEIPGHRRSERTRS